MVINKTIAVDVSIHAVSPALIATAAISVTAPEGTAVAADIFRNFQSYYQINLPKLLKNREVKPMFDASI